MFGWIINLASDGATRETWRDQLPVFFLSDGEPVYEVWHWHPILRRWFVMSMEAVPFMEAQGVVYFRPDEVPEQLRERVYALELAAGFDPKGIRGTDQPG